MSSFILPALLIASVAIVAVTIVNIIKKSPEKKHKTQSPAFRKKESAESRDSTPSIGARAMGAAANFIEGKGHSYECKIQFQTCANCQFWSGERAVCSDKRTVKVFDDLARAKCIKKEATKRRPSNEVHPTAAACKYWEKWGKLK